MKKQLLFLLSSVMMVAMANRVGAQCTGGTPQCSITIEMHDSYGDGWNNGQLHVYQGSTLRGTVTLSSGSSGESTVSVCSDSVTFVWSSGSWDSEISFVVTGADGDTLLAVSRAADYANGDTMATVWYQCPTCPRPSGLHAVTRSHNQLQLAWTGGNGTWQVEYGAAGFSPGSGTTLTVTTPAVTLTGLDSAHWYDVYVTALCDGNETSAPRYGRFATLCGVNTCDMTFIVRDYNWDGWRGNGIRLYQRGSLVDFVTLDNGYMDSVYVPLCHDSVTLVWHQAGEDYDAEFYVYDLSHRLLVGDEGSNYYEGDTIATVMSDCNACPYPEWVDLTHVDTTHATFRWPSTGVGSYVLKLYYNWDSLLYTVTTTDTFYTFSSLTPNTEYRVEVASLCGTDTSGWNEGSVQTYIPWTPIIYVSTTGDDENGGTSWSDALATTYRACHFAELMQEQYGMSPEVWVAQGTYYSSIYISPGLHIYGGLEGNETAGYDMSLRDLTAHPTTLTYNSNVVSQYYILTDSTMALVDGFTLIGGSSTVANLRDYAQLRNCTITGCTMSNTLVRIQNYITNPDMPASLLNCSIVDNTSTSSYIVMLVNARAENCLIARNSAQYYVVRLCDSSVLSHCDVVGNNSQSYYAVTGSSYNNSTSSRLENTIVWGNTRGGSGGNSYQLSGNLIADHSAIQGGYSGTDNINLSAQNEGSSLSVQYPRFVDPTYDYRLNEGSACIDAASGTPGMATDLAGRPRVYGSAADIGCLEWQGEIVCSAVSTAQVSEVTSFSARVEWIAPRSNYMLYYAQQGTTEWDSLSVDADVVGDTTGSNRICRVTLSGLTALTEYVVRLRAICSDSVSGDYELTFQTGCPDFAGSVLIGDTVNYTTTQGNYFPTQTYYNYSATQQIYLASELTGVSTINQLDFFYTYSSSVTRRLKIYLGHTSMNAFGSSSDVVPESQLTLVYDDYYTFSNSPMMNTIMLTTPFNYNGTDNLVVAVIDSTGSYQYSANKFLTFSAPNRSLYFYRDGSPVNFGNVSLYTASYCNVLHLPGECDTTACPAPHFNVTPGVTSATVDWVVSGTAVMEYRATSETDYTAVTLAGSPTTLAGLTPYREYEVRMRNICGTGDSSRWTSHTFTTLPPNVQRLYVKPLASGNGTGTSWSNAMSNLDEALQMADACYALYGTLGDIWVAEGTYYGDTSRNYAFGLVPGVRVYGGFVGNEPDNYDLSQRDLTAHRTILDGRGQRQVANLNTSTQRQRNAVLNGVTIENGASADNGGGVYAYRLDMEYCIVRNNAITNSYYYGGGAYIQNGNIANCLFYGNSSTYYAGGLYSYYSNVSHCDIVNNQAQYYGGLYAYGATMTNTIIWGNRRTNGYADLAYLSYVTVSHCAGDVAISGDSTVLLLAHANMGDDDSLYVHFASPEDRDYRLMEGSACIDMGTGTANSYDLNGTVRPYGTAPDIGCYEYHGERLCIRPVQMSVNDINSFSAMVSWQSERDTVVVEYALANDLQWTSVTVVGRQAVLMPLSSDSRYLVRAKSVCAGEFSPYSDTVAFNTACGYGGHGTTLGNTVGYATSSGNVLPLNAYYRYSYTQTIIDADELGNTAVVIDTLRWQYIYSSTTTRKIQIYLGETDLDELTTGGVAGNTLTRVFAGQVTFNPDDTWFAIPLQLPFNYSGAHNLVIAVIDSTGSYVSSGNRFATHQTDGYKSVYQYTDGSQYTVGNSYSFSRTNYRPNMQFPSNCIDVNCPSPNLIAMEVAPTSATYRTATMGPLQVQYRAAGSDDYIDLTPGETITILGLLQNTTYELRARTVCGVGDTSAWRTVQFTTPLQQTDRLYVTTTGAGLRDGSSWANATANLNWAVATASAIHGQFNNRPQVWVAEGTYYGDTAAANAFTILPGVAVYGGFQGNEPANYNLVARDIASHPTILDGQGVRRVLNQPDNLSDDSTLWDGFTLTGGQAGNNNGGGAYLREGGILANSTVIHCHAYYGGGVYNNGGMLRGCTVTADSAYYGGGVYNYGTIDRATITANRATGSYGGLYNAGTVTRCTIAANRANSSYGGVYNSDGTLSNCLIANNTANSYGGIYIDYGTLYNCHIVANLSTNSTNLNYNYYGTLYNTLFWGNRSGSSTTSSGQIGNSSYSTYYYNCAFESGLPGGVHTDGCVILNSANTGTVTSPLFVQPAIGAGHEYADGCDWTLQEGSILIDWGLADSTVYTYSDYGPATDLVGNPRRQNGRSDIGCYESPYSGITLPEYTDSIIYVTTTGAGLRDGTSWSNAMGNINDAAIYSVMSGYPRIWVAEGTYYGSPNQTNAFVAYDGVDVYGGFAGNEPANYDLSQRDLVAHATILDGQNQQRVLYQPSYFYTMTVWDGLTLQNGHLSSGNGAGAYIYGNLQIANCIVRNNTTLNGNGAGIYKTSNNYPLNIANTQILDNTASGSSAYGGGLYAYYTTVTNCRISGNSAGSGAGICLMNGCNTLNSVIDHNTVTVYPGQGAVYVSGNPRFENCDIVSNSCTYSSSSGTGGVHSYSGSGTFVNCIVWGNKRGYYVNNLSGTPAINSSAIEGGYSEGTDVIDLDASNDGTDPTAFYPRFIDPENGDYHLHTSSPLIDAGDSTLVTQGTDFEGNGRIYGGSVDLGAYESSEASSCPSVIGLRAVNVTSSSARLVWSGQPAGIHYLVMYGPHGSVATDSVSTTDTTVMLANLVLNRTYTARVRTLCDSGVMSLFSIPVNFTTLCDTAQLLPLSDFGSMSPADSTIVYGANVSFAWSALSNATSYDIYIWRSETTEPATPTVAGLPTPTLDNYMLPGYSYGAVYYWKVVAWNECISKVSRVMTIRANDLPNLHVSQITNSSPVANQTMTVQWTVANDGNGNTPPGTTWNDYIWVTGHSGVGGGFLYNVDEVLLATVPNLQALNSGESYTNSALVTLPQDYIGNFFLFVLSDQYSANNIDFTPTGSDIAPIPYQPSSTGTPYPYLSSQTTSYPGNFIHSQMVETNESDNFFYKVINILPPPTPDLVVTHIAHPTNTFSGNQVMVQWTVANQGDAAAIGAWSDRVYIQPGVATELDMTQAVALGTFAHGSDTLAPSASYNHSATVTIPISYMGDYTVFVATDVDDDLYESIYEQNNRAASTQTLTVTLTPPCDLTVTAVSYPYEMDANGSYTVTYTVSNSGSSATHTAGWSDAVYISQSPQLTDNATRLALPAHNGVLDADSSYTVTATVTIPGNIAGGWYLYVVADVDNEVFEYTYEDNNSYRSDTTVTIRVPDLAVETVALTGNHVSPGETFALTYQIANVGNGALRGTAWRDAVYMGTSPQFHRNSATQLLSTRNVATLLPDSSYSNTCSITLPTDVTGNRYIWVVADDQGNVFENGSEENNIVRCADTLYTLLPDLAVTSVTLPDTAERGGTMRVWWTVKNIGAGDVIARSFQDRLRWGSETLYEASLSNITLAAGDSIVRSAVVTVPCSAVSQGAVSVITDVADQVAESGPAGNNTMVANVGTLTSADLTVTVQTPTDSLWSGTTVPLRWMVTNQGNAGVANQNVTDRIYLSQSATSYSPADSVGRYSRPLTLAIGETDTADWHFTLPNGISGNYYLHVVANAAGTVCENESANNVAHSAAVAVFLSPWPDLTVSEVMAPAEVNIGEAIAIQYKVSNIGTAALADQPVSNKIYYSTSASNYSTSHLLYTHSTQLSLPVGDTAQLSAAFVVPPTVAAGNYYIFVVADADNGIYEHTGENNNSAHSSTMRVKVYPLDLTAYDLQGSNTVQWGEQVHQRLVVKNNSTVPTLSAVWGDAVYLSSDPVLHNTDIRLYAGEHRTQLPADSTYQVDFTFTVPMGTPATAYLIAVTDENANNPDINTANNVYTKQITVSSVPTADLAVTEFVILADTVVSGQTTRASYKVTNVGTVPLVPSTWTDKVFLSYNNTLESSDREIGSLLQNRDTIAPDQHYYDTIDFTVPLPVDGNVSLIIKANAGNTVYESVTDNNTAVAAVTVALPLPGDLVVEEIDAADSVVSGSRLQVSWNVRNIGENTLAGNGLRSLVYLSADTVFDAGDKLLGMAENNNVVLSQGAALQQSLSARVAGLPEGGYYLIVKTNVRNAFNELTHDNNTSYSAFAVRLVIRTLEFNTPTADTLLNDQVSDFRLNVGTHRNETVRIHISSADSLNGAVNMIYVSHNTVGDNLHYDFSTIGQYTGNPELYIPATLPQYYGINLYGSTPTGTSQAVVVSADIIPFELRSVSPSMGGNTGAVTLELTGSRFRPDMQVWMAGVSDTLYPDTVIYVNYYKSFATFDLSGKDTGLYDVAVLNHCEGEAMLADAFQIVSGVPDNLGYNLIFPASPRPNRNIVMTLEFGNIGNVDITGAVLQVTSLGGAWISLTPEGLNDHQTTLLVPLTIEGEPDGLLRPGAQGTIPIYGYTGGTLVLTVERHQ